MIHNPKCDSFPDIWQDPRGDEAKRQANIAHRRVYQAARYILTHDFRRDLEDKIPKEPKDFPGNPSQLLEEDIAMMVAVHGILIADNWDPSMGKTTPTQGDLPEKVDGMVVDRRFVEATVAAVKEYTSQNDLFNQCFQLLKTETAPPPAPATTYPEPYTASDDQPPANP